MGAASLRVDSGVKRIEVNDNGDYIAVNISDNSFFKRFDDFVAWLNAKNEEADRIANDSSGDFTERFGAYDALCKEACAELDSLFGSGCCKKVFPDVESPGMELIADFLDQIVPILQGFAAERNQKITSKLRQLSNEDLELLTLLVIYERTQREIAALFGISQVGVLKRIERIKKLFQ